MRSALTGHVAAVAAAGLAVRRTVRDYEQYTVAQSRLRTTLAATTENYRQNATLVGTLADVTANRFGYSLTEANNTMNTMLQTGLGVHRSMRIFETSLQLARVGEIDTAQSTQFLTDTMNMFRMEQARSGEETRHFARRMATQLSVSANMASTNIQQLQQAFRFAGGEMSAMNFSSQETMAALAGVSSMGLRGSTAGTCLRQAMAKLIRITPQTYRVFRRLGIQQDELNQIMFTADGRRRSLAEGMSRLTDVFRRLPNEQGRALAMFQLFGLRGTSAGTALAGSIVLYDTHHKGNSFSPRPVKG